MKKTELKSLIFSRRTLTVVLCIIMVMVTLGFTSSTSSLFPDEIAKELGVSRSLVVIGQVCRYLATTVVNIFFGLLISRFGEKKLICAGFLALISSMLLYAAADNLFMIYAGGALLGVGLSWTTTSMVGHIVSKWCSENKGTVMGIVLASNGIGGAIAIQLVGGLIDPSVTGSYRKAYLLIACVLTGTALLTLLFFRNKKQTADIPVIKKKKGSRAEWSGISVGEALHKFYFWGILICIFFSGFILQGTSGIAAMHYKDVGIDYGKIKAMLSFGSLILAGAKFCVGFSLDRLGLRFTASFCTAIAAVSAIIMAFTTGDRLGFFLAILYVVISPLALPLETVMLPIYASELFGSQSFANFLGIIVSVNTAGYMIGTWAMNLCYDIMGSYYYALIAVGIIMLLLLVLLQFTISAAKKERRRIESEESKKESLKTA